MIINVKASFSLNNPQSDPLHGEAEFNKAYWMRQFGFSRQDSHKGIVLVKVS